ncbi:hypothetical protein [Adhaeribacter radiodurans]|uniref:Uncharacterized protein n=1 Tax=Adhaeribacter radiodurans TaxID=2745197 RepID=A0A7L7L465_9BACT|nr:hypothetical protein [Adhaeribacter radiodurans]QMU27597.1 hypothetical protein HUW48_05860 [Adhaeribacter radiodurans]
MKYVKYILVAFGMLIYFESQSQTNERNDFLVRFKTFTTAHSPKIKSFMPLVNPGSNLTSMPNAIDTSKAYMEDSVTGLRIFPQLGKVYDPKTGYSIAYDSDITYHVDLKAGKVFQDQSEVKVERNQKVD